MRSSSSLFRRFRTESPFGLVNICFTSSIAAKLFLIKFFDKMMGTCFFLTGRKNNQNLGIACLGLKIGKIQKTFLLQVFATLWTTDG